MGARIVYACPKRDVLMHPDEAMDACVALLYLDLDSQQARSLLSANHAGDGSRLQELFQMLAGADGRLRPLASRVDYSQIDERKERAAEPGEWPRVRLMGG